MLYVEFFCYAYDTVIPIKSHNYDNLYKIANNCISAVKHWCDNNNLGTAKFI